jgi:hypothetical protein
MKEMVLPEDETKISNEPLTIRLGRHKPTNKEMVIEMETCN